MGLEPAVHIANGILAGYEYDFVKQLIGGDGDETEWHLLNEFRYCRRYIDDMLMIGAVSFDKLLYLEQTLLSAETGRQIKGIYPHGVKPGDENAGNTHDVKLTINLEHKNRGADNRDQSVIFLDMEIDWDTNRGEFAWSTYDKRRNRKHDLAPMTRLMPQVACIWPTAKSGVITSEMHRALYTCSTMPRFVAQTARIIYEAYRKGYPWGVLEQKAKKFLDVQVLYVGADNCGWTASKQGTWDIIEAAVWQIWSNGLRELDHRHATLGFEHTAEQPEPPPKSTARVPDSVRHHLL